MMSSLIDGSTYSDCDGKKGHYSYDGGSGILTMTDDNRKGWNYQRIASATFRHVDEHGKEAAYACPLEPREDPLKRLW